MDKRLCNRSHAGNLLAKRLNDYAGREDVLILAIANNGIPVGCAVAEALDVALDVLTVSRIPVPDHPEITLGAVAQNDIFIRNAEIIERYNIPQDVIEKLEQEAYFHMEKQDTKFHSNNPIPELDGRTIILVDDGIETGATMRAAITAIGYAPDSIIVAIPVVSTRVCKMIADEVDEVISLLVPREEPVYVSRWYDESADVSDDEAVELLSHPPHSLLRKKAFYSENAFSQ
jgi:putative phosphoribosyl transferase